MYIYILSTAWIYKGLLNWDSQNQTAKAHASSLIKPDHGFLETMNILTCQP